MNPMVAILEDCFVSQPGAIINHSPPPGRFSWGHPGLVRSSALHRDNDIKITLSLRIIHYRPPIQTFFAAEARISKNYWPRQSASKFFGYFLFGLTVTSPIYHVLGPLCSDEWVV